MAQVEHDTSLTSLERVKQHALIDSEAYDAELTTLIKEVSARVQQYLGRHVLSRTWIHVGTQSYYPRLNSYGGTLLFLPEMPITSVTASTFKLIPSSTALVEGWDKDFVVHSHEGIIELVNGRSFYTGSGIVELIYTAGYLTAPSAGQESWLYGYDEASAQIRHATTIQTAAVFHAKQRLREGVASISSEGVSVQYLSGAWHPEAQDILERMRVRMPSCC